MAQDQPGRAGLCKGVAGVEVVSGNGGPWKHEPVGSVSG